VARWNQPVIPIAIEKETKRAEKISKGGVLTNELREEVELILNDFDIQRIAHGYVCIHCQEPFERPFPKRCSVCGFPCRDLQQARFVRDYKGTETPLTPLLEKVDDLVEKGVL
jgi:hypothetical protein